MVFLPLTPFVTLAALIVLGVLLNAAAAAGHLRGQPNADATPSGLLKGAGGFLQLRTPNEVVDLTQDQPSDVKSQPIKHHAHFDLENGQTEVATNPDDFESWYAGTVARGRYFTSVEQLLSQVGDQQFDAIVIPSGGLEDDGTPKVFVKARLDAMGPYKNMTKYWISSGAYSPRVAVKTSASGAVLGEGRAGAQYLANKFSVPLEQILVEEGAKDSIGNAYFTRLMAEVLQLRKILVVTNRFQMPRIRLVFDRTYTLAPYRPYALYYLEVPDVGLDSDVLAGRQEKERQSMVKLWFDTFKVLDTMTDMGKYIHIHHRAYAMDTNAGDYNITVDPAVLEKTY